jgi:hypothetical protein
MVMAVTVLAAMVAVREDMAIAVMATAVMVTAVMDMEVMHTIMDANAEKQPRNLLKTLLTPKVKEIEKIEKKKPNHLCNMRTSALNIEQTEKKEEKPKV